MLIDTPAAAHTGRAAARTTANRKRCMLRPLFIVASRANISLDDACCLWAASSPTRGVSAAGSGSNAGAIAIGRGSTVGCGGACRQPTDVGLLVRVAHTHMRCTYAALR